MSFHKTDAQRGERGAVLIIVLMVMIVLLSLGVASLWLTTGNLRISSSISQRSAALFCAEAGLERARALLNSAPRDRTAQFLTVRLPGTGQEMDDVPMALTPEGQPDGLGAILVDAEGPMVDVPFPPASFQRTSGTAEAPTNPLMGRYTVWMRNDAAEARQGAFSVDTNSSVVVRSRCVAPDGRTNVVLELTFIPPLVAPTIRVLSECLDSGKNLDDANTNTLHCSRGG